MSVVPGSFKRVGEKKGPLVIGGAEKKMNEDEACVERFEKEKSKK